VCEYGDELPDSINWGVLSLSGELIVPSEGNSAPWSYIQF
jgi:hypothetical protein